MARCIHISVWFFMICLFFASPALAHKVTVFAWAQGDTVFTESKFSGGKVVKGGQVEVFDMDGTLLLEGLTDDQGAFSFKAPKIADLNIVLTAGMGHQNSWIIAAGDLGSAKEAKPAPSEAQPVDLSKALSPSAAAPGLTAKEIEAIVARQLDEKIQPLTRMMVESRDKGPTLTDILGGMGYILGLVGLGAYMRYRKDPRQP